MDSRIIYSGLALFVTAYAQTTPLFFVFGVKANVVLVLAVLSAFSVRTLYASVFFVVCATLGLMSGAGFIQSILFFSLVFATVQVVRRAVPWQPFLSACVLVLFFSCLTYASLDGGVIIRSAPQFAREALYNLITLAIIYAFLPHYHAQQGRY